MGVIYNLIIHTYIHIYIYINKCDTLVMYLIFLTLNKVNQFDLLLKILGNNYPHDLQDKWCNSPNIIHVFFFICHMLLTSIPTSLLGDSSIII